MNAPVERKKFLALLAAGGARIVASRIMPFPHRYRVEYPGGSVEITEEQAAELVERKLLTAKPQDDLWDTINFELTDLATVRSDALGYYKCGFGRCATCGEVVGLGSGTNAARHGHSRADHTPPCEGSGKPVVYAVAA